MKTFKYFLVFGLMLFSFNAISAYTTDDHVIKINSQAAQGSCLLPFNGRDPNMVLRQHGVTVYTARNKPGIPNKSGCQEFSTLPNRSPLSDPQDPRIIALARALTTLSNIGNHNLTEHKNIKVVFGSVYGPARQCTDHIQLNPGRQNCLGLGNDTHGGSDNIAMIIHEIGHQISNKNNREKLSKYEQAVPKKCKLTTYAGKNRGEEFSEVLAAYVTNPSLFQDKGEHCKKAFAFMADLFGETPDNEIALNMTCESRTAALRTALGLRRQRTLREHGLRPYEKVQVVHPNYSGSSIE